MLDIKPHIINKNKFQMKVSETMSLKNKFNTCHLRRRCPGLCSWGGVEGEPHYRRLWGSTFLGKFQRLGWRRAGVLGPKALAQRGPVPTPGRCTVHLGFPKWSFGMPQKVTSGLPIVPSPVKDGGGQHDDKGHFERVPSKLQINVSYSYFYYHNH